MATTEQRLAELERQVAELSASLEGVAAQAAVVRTLTEMRLDRLAAVWPAGSSPRRPCHLHAVEEGAW